MSKNSSTNGGLSAPGNRMQTEIVRWPRMPDERDSFILWIRGEFAAANAIIDALCQHLQISGEPGEYDPVLNSIQQRRSNWYHVLHRQQYFSVAEVLAGIQHVSWRRQQRKPENFAQFGNAAENSSLNTNSFRNAGQKKNKPWRDDRSVRKINADAQVHEGDGAGSGAADKGKRKEDKDYSAATAVVSDSSTSDPKSRAEVESDRSNSKEKNGSSEDSGSVHVQGGNEGILIQNSFKIMCKEEENTRRSLLSVTKNFVGNELVDGKMINIMDGLELYGNVFDSAELSVLTTATQELKLAGKRRELRGQTFVVSKRPMKGHGREMLQFGVPVSDIPMQEENGTSRGKDFLDKMGNTCTDQVEPIPKIFQDVINRLLQWQIIPANSRPDSCIINFFNEGDHLQPHIYPAYFERPFCTISLMEECNLVFGRTITVSHHGDYKGLTKISLPAGSILVMQGNGADIAKYSLCSTPIQRITVTLVKVQPRKAALSTGVPHPPPVQNSQWSQSASQQLSANASAVREGRGVRQPTSKHFVSLPTSGVLPVPPVNSQINQQLPSPGIPPLFAAPPQGPTGAYPAMAVIPSAWPAVPRPTPRMLSSGTGVFLPAGGTSAFPGQFLTFPQQHQSFVEISSAVPNGEASFAPEASCSTAQLSKDALSNQSSTNSFERDTETSTTVVSSKINHEIAVSKTALNKDTVSIRSKSEANGGRQEKLEHQNKVPSQSKATGSKPS